MAQIWENYTVKHQSYIQLYPMADTYVGCMAIFQPRPITPPRYSVIKGTIHLTLNAARSCRSIRKKIGDSCLTGESELILNGTEISWHNHIHYGPETCQSCCTFAGAFYRLRRPHVYVENPTTFFPRRWTPLEMVPQKVYVSIICAANPESSAVPPVLEHDVSSAYDVLCSSF